MRPSASKPLPVKLLAAALLGLGAVQPLAPLAPAPALAFQQDDKAPAQDTLILANGTVLTGKIVSETASTLTLESSRGGISSTTQFQKSEILEIKRAAKSDAPKAPAGTPAARPLGIVESPATRPAAPAPQEDPRSDTPKVYLVPLEGTFGEQITQTPMREAMRDAQRQGADVIIFRLNNRWSDELGLQRLPDDTANFDEIFRAEDITPVLSDELLTEWQTPPRVVIWVDQAMAGAALLPLVVPEIYFTSNGRMGGLGNLQFLFESTGDATVRQKQYSLRLAHAEGWANKGGYPVELVRAMASFDYVLSYRLEGGRPVFFNRMPEGPGEILLTDDGAENTPRADTNSQRVRGEGNDFLTLNARLARDLSVSRGTADSLDDLLLQMGLSRSATVIKDRGERIMQRWSTNLDNAKDQIVRLLEEYNEIQVEGETPADRNADRSRQLRKINEIEAVLSRFEEAITQRWLAENQVPAVDERRAIKERIRIAMMQDR